MHPSMKPRPETETGGHHAFPDVTLGETRYQRNRTEAEGEILPRPQRKGKIGNDGRYECCNQNGEDRSEERSCDADGKRLVGFTSERHGITVETGCNRGGGTGDADQNSRDERTGDSSDPDRKQQHKTGLCGKTKGHGQQQCNAQCCAQTGDRTENNTECYHSENEHEVDGLEADQQGGTV